MPTYRATNRDTQEVVEYNEAQPRAEHLVPPWRVAEIVVPPPPDDPPPPPPYDGPWKITRLAFLNRFTDAEAIAFDLASQGATQGAAALRRYLSKVNAAEYIDLQRQDTRAGVEALEAAGLLATGRAAEILDTSPAEEELHRG